MPLVYFSANLVPTVYLLFFMDRFRASYNAFAKLGTQLVSISQHNYLYYYMFQTLVDHLFTNDEELNTANLATFFYHFLCRPNLITIISVWRVFNRLSASYHPWRDKCLNRISMWYMQFIITTNTNNAFRFTDAKRCEVLTDA